MPAFHSPELYNAAVGWPRPLRFSALTTPPLTPRMRIRILPNACMRGMPVWLKNLQSSVRFGEHLLRLQTNFILGLAGAGRYDVSVVCVESESIRNLNRVYRNVDRATDVLAFPYHEVWE